MKRYRSGINRREFLAVGSAALLSPLFLTSFKMFPTVKTANAADASPQGGEELGQDAWLALTEEAAIDPELPICDPHHHMWQGYLLADLLKDIGGGHNIVKTVYIEAWGRNQDVGTVKMTQVEETAFAAAESRSMPSRTEVAAGIVGNADLTVGKEVLPLLEAHLEAGKGRFRGIRAAAARGSVKMDDKYREGCAQLHRLGLSLDAYVPYSSFKELADLANDFPDMPIIANHIGNPAGIGTGDSKAEETVRAWKAGIKELAASPNVYLKLGGMGMTSFGFGWNKRPVPPGSEELARAMSPLIHYCVEQVGPARCMFESNFPVDRVSYSYTVLWNAFKLATKAYSSTERGALFYDTAAKVYRI